MNKKGFTLVELLGCLLLLAVILCIGLYSARGTLATALSTLTDVSENEIYDTAKIYVLENGVTWINVGEEEYTCLTVKELVDKGYLETGKVNTYNNDYIKVIRKSDTKSILHVELLDSCE